MAVSVESLQKPNEMFKPERRAALRAILGGIFGGLIGEIFLPFIGGLKGALAGAIATGSISWINERIGRKSKATSTL